MSSASVSLMEVGHSFLRGPSLLSKYLNKSCLNCRLSSALWPLNKSSEGAFYRVFNFLSLRFVFRCRVIFPCVYTHVNFNDVNKIKARYKVLSLNVKLTEVLLLRLHATFHALPLFYFRVEILCAFAL